MLDLFRRYFEHGYAHLQLRRHDRRIIIHPEKFDSQPIQKCQSKKNERMRARQRRQKAKMALRIQESTRLGQLDGRQMLFRSTEDMSYLQNIGLESPISFGDQRMEQNKG